MTRRIPTPEQKAKHAAAERARRAAKREAAHEAAGITAEQTAAYEAGQLDPEQTAAYDAEAADAEAESFDDKPDDEPTTTGERTETFDPEADAVVNAIVTGKTTFTDAAMAILNGASLTDVAEAISTTTGLVSVTIPGPNLAAATTTPKPARTPTGARAPEGFQRAMAIKAKGPRGKGTKVTDEQLIAAAARWCNEGLTQRQAADAVYWIDGYSMGYERFAKVTADLFTRPVEEVAAS